MPLLRVLVWLVVQQETIRSHIPIGQPILVQEYILQVQGKVFLDALTNGNRFRAMRLN